MLLRFLAPWMVVAATALPFCQAAEAASNPTISKVVISGTNENKTVKLIGSGFGNAPKGAPCNACSTPFLSLYDAALPIGWGDGGRTWNILSWSNTEIVASGFQGDPGDAVGVTVWNAATKKPAAWAGNIASEFTTPIISGIALSGKGATLQMTISGSGFGSAPAGVPELGDTIYLAVCDAKPATTIGVTWCGGYHFKSVALNYTSWADKKIVINGFGSSYGTNGQTVNSGDPLVFYVFNTGYQYHGQYLVPQTAAVKIAP